MNEKKPSLTSAEIGSLWTSYMNDCLATCMTGHMLKYVEDPEIKPIIQSAYDISIRHQEQLRTIFNQEAFAIPTGFSEQDVNMNAPRIFSDVFCLTYVNNMAKIEMVTYSGFVAMSLREDIRNYFTQALTESAQVYNQSASIALTKGISIRPPSIEVPKETDYVDSKKYLSGLNPFNDKRPVNAVEISHLHMNVKTNTLGFKLSLAFAQTSPSKDVQDYMLEGKDIAQKHMKKFADILLNDNIQMPHSPDVGVSHSTTQTFSDKLMMFHMSVISAAGIGNYATAAAASQRLDLAMNYERFSVEIAGFAKSGADLMIKHNWLEQPPGTMGREELARNKEGS